MSTVEICPSFDNDSEEPAVDNLKQLELMLYYGKPDDSQSLRDVIYLIAAELRAIRDAGGGE